MKHFVDIERVREVDEELKANNCQRFAVGDRVVIQTKIDGANSSATWEDGEVKCFSRKNELSPINTLRGFWNYIQELDKTMFETNPNWIIFGEWLVKHTIIYNADMYNQWYVYDIYDKVLQSYLPQTVVKEFCSMWNLNYIETLYEGEFKSWEHVREFLGASKIYGDRQEGIVIKNQEHLFGYEVEDGRQPSYIKIVNSDFSEVKQKNHEQKVQDPQKLEAKAKAEEIMSTIITEARVRKEINKMIDEGILPEKISPRDMGTVAKNLPKRIMEDCLKEEKETVYSAGEYCGKVGSVITMNIAKKIILG
jgi:hypothetical protein